MKRFGKWFGSSMLVIASIFMLASIVSCGDKKKQTGGKSEKDGKEMFDITFGVAPSEAGSITAKVDGKNITSPAKVEKDKEIVFTLEIKDKTKYVVDKWVGAKEESDKMTAKLTVAGKVDVKAILKEIKKDPEKDPEKDPKPTHKVTFKVVDEKGAEVDATKASIKATKKAKDATSESDLNSGEAVAKDTDLTFTLTISDKSSYEFVDWEGADQDAANQLKATKKMADADITVTAKVKMIVKEIKKHKVNFAVDPEGLGSIAATKKLGSDATPVPFNNGDDVEEGAELEFTLTITDNTRFNLKDWDGADKDASNNLKAKKTLGTADINVKAMLERIGKAITFNVNPSEQGTLKVVDGAGNILKSGDKVKKDDDLTFELTITKPAEYEVKKWTVATQDENTPTRATLKMPDSEATVTAELQEVKNKVATLKTVKIQLAEAPNTDIAEVQALDLTQAEVNNSTGLIVDLPYEKANGKKLKFVVTTEPSDSTVTYDPVVFGTTGEAVSGIKPVTVKVAKTGFKGTDYVFKLQCKEVLKCTKIKLGDVYTLQESDLGQAASKDGFSYVFEKTQTEVVIETEQTAGASVDVKIGNTTSADKKCTLTETDQEVTITLSKSGCATVVYKLKLRKAPATTPKKELKSLTIAGETLSVDDLDTAKSGTLAWDIKKDLSNTDITWDSEAARVEVKVKKANDAKFGDAEDKTAEKKYTLSKLASDYQMEVEIIVYEVHPTTDSNKMTSYKFVIGLEE